MKPIAALARRVVASCKEVLQTVWSVAWDAVIRLRAWHEALVESDPLYPVVLAAGGGVLVRAFVPSRMIGGAIVDLLEALTGRPTGLFSDPVSRVSTGYGRKAPAWADDDWDS